MECIYGIKNNSSISTIVMNGGNITTTNHDKWGINVNYGSAEIIDGSVNGIYVASGATLTLGEDDSTVAQIPEIGGSSSVGAVVNEGTFNFYDGYIDTEGYTQGEIGRGLIGIANTVPDNYKVGYLWNKSKVMLILDNIVAINEDGSEYTDLQTAIDEAEDGDNVSIQDDIIVSESINVDKELVLFTNSYTLSSNTSSAYVINNTGDLTLQGDGTIKSTAEGTIYNTGGLTILEYVTVNNEYTSDYAIYNEGGEVYISDQSTIKSNYAGIYLNAGSLDLVENSSVIASSSYAIRTVSTNGAVKVRIDDDVIVKTESTSSTGYAIYMTGETETEITGGSVISENGRGIYVSNNSSTKLTLGSSDTLYDPSITNPSITGATYGVYIAGSSANVYFYDGILKGKTGAVNNSSYIDEVEDGYTLTSGTDGDYKTLTLR